MNQIHAEYYMCITMLRYECRSGLESNTRKKFICWDMMRLTPKFEKFICWDMMQLTPKFEPIPVLFFSNSMSNYFVKAIKM